MTKIHVVRNQDRSSQPFVLLPLLDRLFVPYCSVHIVDPEPWCAAVKHSRGRGGYADIVLLIRPALITHVSRPTENIGDGSTTLLSETSTYSGCEFHTYPSLNVQCIQVQCMHTCMCMCVFGHSKGPHASMCSPIVVPLCCCVLCRGSRVVVDQCIRQQCLLCDDNKAPSVRSFAPTTTGTMGIGLYIQGLLLLQKSY